MAEKLFLVSKADSEEPNETLIDGIYAMLINADDAHTDAQVITHAEAQCVAAGHPVRANYFDTVTAIADLSTGVLKDDLDTYIFLPRKIEAYPAT